MAENTLPESDEWVDGIYQLETDDKVLGGADGVSNRQGKELASRTRFLKSALAALGMALSSHAASRDHPSATTKLRGMTRLATLGEHTEDRDDVAATPAGLRATLPLATTTTPGISLRATPEDIAAKTDPNKTVSPADLAGLDGLPVGALLDIYGDDSAAPPGYLLCNCAAVTATYPALRAFGLARGWPRNANGDPLLPESGGYFRRGWRTGQLIDSGRVFGTSQGDAIRNIAGNFHGGDHSEVATGPFTSGASVGTIQGGSGATKTWTFDASRVVPTAADNRPHNYTCTTWIKAYPASTTPGSIDLANLVNDIADAAQRVAALENRLGYTVLYPGGTEAAPATISNNQRVVIDNPFAPAACIVQAQIYVGNQWVWSGHVTSNDLFYFTSASTLGNQIVVQTGLTQIGRRGPVGGSPFTTPDYVASALYRVLVWKLAGAT